MIRQVFYSGPSFEDLHENYTKQGRIDEKAPVKSTSDILIQAPVERVWEQLVRVQDWPTMDPSYRNVQLESTISVDSYFRFVLNNFPRTGLSLWFKAVDLHVLEPTEHGATRVHIAESLSGVMASLLISSRQLKKQHDRWLAAFKRAVEEKQQ